MIFTKKEDLQLELDRLKKKKFSVGFVPTMGALHKGHLSLVKKALSENKYCVVSIYVNPTQFDNKEDLKKYPRNINDDAKLLKTVSDNKILIYSPSDKEIYGKEISSRNFSFDGLEHQMEGKFRDGHFNGVGTILTKLFNIVNPDKAYFGEKDFQQLQIVKKLSSKYNLNVEIIGCEIIREKNGLARSSRNERLSEKIRSEAGIILETIKKAKVYFEKNSAQKTKKFVENEFSKLPDFTLEYVEIANIKTLETTKRKQTHRKYRMFIAVFADGIRLIDNIALNY